MILNSDGTFIRDIDIEELKIVELDSGRKYITLKRNQIIYRYILLPNIVSYILSESYYIERSVHISNERFLLLSDEIHKMGLLNIQWEKRVVCNTKNIFAYLICTFDDGSRYELFVQQENRPKEYDIIVNILNSI